MTTPLTIANPVSPSALSEPYVSVSEFRASPTWLDTDDLVESGSPEQQDAELYNVLLKSSEWADQFCNQRLAAHVEYEQMRVRVDRQGRAYIHPSNYPVRSVTGLAFGGDPQNMSQLTDLTQVWVEDQQGIVVSLIPMRGSFFGSLEFGGTVVPSSMYTFVQVAYVAGYVSTTLAASAASGDPQIVVKDATGILGPPTTLIGSLPGSTLRIWDPGQEEAVSVASGYTLGNTTVPLASPLAHAHVSGTSPEARVQVSEMPAPIHQAVIDMAVAMMLRQDTAGQEPFAGESFGPAAKRSSSGGATAGLLDHAYEMLEPYVRRR